jgi:DNA-binding response OmpR family regulator
VAAVLIVEDEPAIAALIEIHVKMAGHNAYILQDGDKVLERIKGNRPDIIILDVMLPGRDGFSLMEELRPLGIPVIFLTAKDRLEDKIAGLRLGADDYIVKPFAAVELTTRIETVLRRCKASDGIFRLGKLEVRMDERLALVDNQEIDLAAKEFELLKVLIENKNLALTRDKLLELAWGFDFMGETRTVDVHIQRLRKKLGLESSIRTVFKHGYRLEVPR